MITKQTSKSIFTYTINVIMEYGVWHCKTNDNKKTWEALNVYFITNYSLNENFTITEQGWQPGKPKWELLVWDLS